MMWEPGVVSERENSIGGVFWRMAAWQIVFAILLHRLCL